MSGQESAWDYPRPPRLETTRAHLKVVFAGKVIAETRCGYRVLETSHPPVYYFPPEEVAREFLRPAESDTLCEYKGTARYWDLVVGSERSARAAWSYPKPWPGFEPLGDFLAFYAGRVEGCFVDGERASPQPGGFYGGWVTSSVAGPFKGAPGTAGW